MCLAYDLTKPRADKIKAEARKRGYIRVYKVCDRKYTGWMVNKWWKDGLQKAGNIKTKNGGWYAYLSLYQARRFRDCFNSGLSSNYSIKVCYAKPSWIKRLGGDWDNNRVGIFTHLCFPDWDKGDMTIREFRAMSKGKP